MCASEHGAPTPAASCPLLPHHSCLLASLQPHARSWWTRAPACGALNPLHPTPPCPSSPAAADAPFPHLHSHVQQLVGPGPALTHCPSRHARAAGGRVRQRARRGVRRAPGRVLRAARPGPGRPAARPHPARDHGPGAAQGERLRVRRAGPAVVRAAGAAVGAAEPGRAGPGAGAGGRACEWWEGGVGGVCWAGCQAAGGRAREWWEGGR